MFKDSQRYNITFCKAVPNIDRPFMDMEYRILNEAREAIADKIVHSKMRKDVGEWSTEYSLNLYVFSPEEFWEIVQKEAARLSSSMNFTKGVV